MLSVALALPKKGSRDGLREDRWEARRKKRRTLMGGQEDMRPTQTGLIEWAGINCQMGRHADPAPATW